MEQRVGNTAQVNVGRFIVRDGMDWGEFYVGAIRGTDEHGGERFAVTVSCVTSYGVFGHHWSHCSSSAADFLSRINEDYLLGKIARQVFNGERFATWMYREIFTSSASGEG